MPPASAVRLAAPSTMSRTPPTVSLRRRQEAGPNRRGPSLSLSPPLIRGPARLEHVARVRPGRGRRRIGPALRRLPGALLVIVDRRAHSNREGFNQIVVVFASSACVMPLAETVSHPVRPVAQFIVICSSSILAEMRGISASFWRGSRAQRGTAERRRPQRID